MLYGFPSVETSDIEIVSLNPYFFGKCSTAGAFSKGKDRFAYVLILIFLENALRPPINFLYHNYVVEVLILIFLENALRQ